MGIYTNYQKNREQIVLYMFFNTTYNIFFPSLVFSIVSLYMSYKYFV